jgi:hypothetical protein
VHTQRRIPFRRWTTRQCITRCSLFHCSQTRSSSRPEIPIEPTYPKLSRACTLNRASPSLTTRDNTRLNPPMIIAIHDIFFPMPYYLGKCYKFTYLWCDWDVSGHLNDSGLCLALEVRVSPHQPKQMVATCTSLVRFYRGQRPSDDSSCALDFFAARHGPFEEGQTCTKTKEKTLSILRRARPCHHCITARSLSILSAQDGPLIPIPKDGLILSRNIAGSLDSQTGWP